MNKDQLIQRDVVGKIARWFKQWKVKSVEQRAIKRCAKVADDAMNGYIHTARVLAKYKGADHVNTIQAKEKALASKIIAQTIRALD